MARSDVEIRIDGAAQIRAVQQELRRLGDKRAFRYYYRGLNRATKPLRAAAQREALRTLPKRGGLAARVAQEKLRATNRSGGVSIVGPNNRQLRLIDAGFVRHPVWGNREVWRTQPVMAGYFSRPMEDGAPVARKEVLVEMDKVARVVADRITARAAK